MGLVVLFPEPVNPKAEAVLAGHGLDMSSHAAEQFAQSDLQNRNLILVMTKSPETEDSRGIREPG